MYRLWIKVYEIDENVKRFIYAGDFDTKEECIREYDSLKTIDKTILYYDIEYITRHAIFSDDIQ